MYSATVAHHQDQLKFLKAEASLSFKMTKADQQTPRALILKLLTHNMSSSDGGGDETAVHKV